MIDAALGWIGLVNSTLSGNTAQGYGGAIALIGGESYIDSSIISGNSVVDGAGGGISIADSSTYLEMYGSTLSGNTAGGTSGSGGGMYVAGLLDITTTTLSGNTATGTCSWCGGGGMLIDGSADFAEAFMSEVTFENNSGEHGGGLTLFSGNVWYGYKIAFKNNTAPNGTGGGLHIENGYAAFEESTFAGNQATGSSGKGGGIFTYVGITLSNTTLSGNSAGDQGGGIYSDDGTTTIENVTIANNSAGDQGGGVFSALGTTTITNATIANNTANENYGGVARGAGNVSLINTIIANNTGGANGNCSGGIITETGSINMQWPATAPCGTGSEWLTDDPVLGPLTNNGGSTETMALLTFSPAMDKLNTENCPYTDQRGKPRLNLCDIGAYENTLPTLVVNRTDDDLSLVSNPENAVCTPTDCMLRAAVILAVNDAKIVFNSSGLTGNSPGCPAYPCTITLAQDLRIDKSLTIEGPGADTLTISGGDVDRIFEIAWGTIMIKGMTLTDGVDLFNGGAIHAGGQVTLDSLIIKNSRASGGGIWTSGTMTVMNTSIYDNNTNTEVNGGGIRNHGNLTIINSTIFRNGMFGDVEGGAIFNDQGTVNIINSTIVQNKSYTGGIHNDGGTIVLKNTILADNYAGDLNTKENCVGFSGDGAGGGFNVDYPQTSCNFTSAITSDPKLVIPGNYAGGPFALANDSPAIDAGTNVGCPEFDQRGVQRPVGPQCDIGAYESTESGMLRAGNSSPQATATSTRTPIPTVKPKTVVTPTPTKRLAPTFQPPTFQPPTKKP